MEDAEKGYIRDEMYDEEISLYEIMSESSDNSQVARNHRRRVARNKMNENAR